jgi:hypothetical protein
MARSAGAGWVIAGSLLLLLAALLAAAVLRRLRPVRR